MQAKQGDVVAVHYVGKLDNGEVFDSSEGREPLEFTLGEKQVIPGFEKAVEGLAKGETRTVRIPPEEAYGAHDPAQVFKLDRAMFGDHPVEVGQHLNLADERGNTFHVDVVAVDDKSVTVDANPHLAGEALTFSITLVTVNGQ